MILSVLSGILSALSMPGMLFGGLVWFSLVPLLVSIRRTSPVKAGLLSLAFMFTHVLISHYWLAETLSRNLPLVLGRYPRHLGLLVFLGLLLLVEISLAAKVNMNTQNSVSTGSCML